ncbi:MAG TPA: formate dehydrogenase accessory sulfurtransferase FdhD [Novimethylophilus sp.]|jgi:FdhD protein|uniref:formate dehydrogenase accessory sulfurtransferase FdhD n=1 Tax=Novimethylophilus sp. TaxID=2137426 RepID=UPI002F42E1E1
MEAVPLSYGLPEEVEVASYHTRAVERWGNNGTLIHAIDQVAEEVPVAMVYNGISHAVMLATPMSLEQFGLGFSLSEGILHSRRELYDMEVVKRKDGIELQMTISQERFVELKQRRRNLAGRTGCGLCGAESLQQVLRHPKPVACDRRFGPEVVHTALRRLSQMQSLQTLTGAVHAAVWVTANGSIAYIEEDIGRHNALDKLIGTLAKNSVDLKQGFAIVTSRASYEMVQKAATIGIPMMVAVSAPTCLAIDMAQRAGLTLVGFARGGGHVIYTHSQRFVDQQKPS